MKRGYWAVIVGFVVFVGCIIVGASTDADGQAADLLVLGSLLALSLGIWIGTAIIAVEKGHHVVLGIILGFIGPFGLLVVTILPDRSKTP